MKIDKIIHYVCVNVLEKGGLIRTKCAVRKWGYGVPGGGSGPGSVFVIWWIRAGKVPCEKGGVSGISGRISLTGRVQEVE